MCGIFAYYHFNVRKDLRFITEVLFNGLRRLEYRGYDSAGVCIDSADAYDVVNNGDGIDQNEGPGPSPLVFKSEGNIDALQKMTMANLEQTKVDLSQQFLNHAAIAHTRWATHGSPSATNSHPHVSDPDCEFVVVHNGIITNYKILRDFLLSHGETFVSETDTEVIPKLFKYVFSNLETKIPFPKLVMEVMKQLEGAYAILVKSIRFPGKLLGNIVAHPVTLESWMADCS